MKVKSKLGNMVVSMMLPIVIWLTLDEIERDIAEKAWKDRWQE